MPKYDPEVAPLSRLMDSSLRICIVSLTLVPLACPIFYVGFPEIPIFPNTAVKQVLQNVVPIVAPIILVDPEIVYFLHTVALVVDFPIVFVASYMIFCVILAFGMMAIVYCGKYFLENVKFRLISNSKF